MLSAELNNINTVGGVVGGVLLLVGLLTFNVVRGRFASSFSRETLKFVPGDDSLV